MECNVYNLSKERHKLCTDENNKPIYNEGYLVVFDMTDKKLISVPVTDQSLAFFQLQQLVLDQPIPENVNLESNNTFMSTQSTTQHASWKDNNATTRLIYAWKEHEDEFKSEKYKSSEVWKKIAILLQNENSQWVYTGIQCENKFKELRKKYVKVNDHNKQSGNSPMTCKFFNEFEKVLKEKPFIQPVALASNLRKQSATPSSSQDSEVENDSGKEYNEKKKVKKTRVQKELAEWSAVLRDDTLRREEAREQRHKELVAASDRAVAVYKEMMGKLIDKL